MAEFLLKELDVIEPGGVGVMLVGDHDADLGIGLLGDDLAAGKLPAGIGDGIGIKGAVHVGVEVDIGDVAGVAVGLIEAEHEAELARARDRHRVPLWINIKIRPRRGG